MYDLFIGNHERVMGMTVYHKRYNKYIPCRIMNYYFKSRKYALVPIEDLDNIPDAEHEKRRLFYTTKIYLKIDKSIIS